MDTLVSTDIIAFGDFRLDRRAHRLLRRSENGGFAAVPVGSRALELLRVLVEHAGELVSRHEIMDAVWPRTAVEEGNLTVQLSSLRRLLDAGRTGGSCIQTVPGQGYQFVEPVTVSIDAGMERGDVSVPRPAFAPPRPVSSRLWLRLAVAACVLVPLVLIAAARFGGVWSAAAVAPRMSLVVMPFDNLGTDPKDTSLAEGITADLTNDLARDMLPTVSSAASASAYKGQAVDPRRIGRALHDLRQSAPDGDGAQRGRGSDVHRNKQCGVVGPV